MPVRLTAFLQYPIIIAHLPGNFNRFFDFSENFFETFLQTEYLLYNKMVQNVGYSLRCTSCHKFIPVLE